MSNKKVVLAYSGGLDTSYCLSFLKNQGCEVHAVSVNTGSFNDQEIKELEEKAILMGAASYKCIDAEKQYYQNAIRYLIFGNVLRNNCYPLSVSAERMFQALEIAKYSKLINADAIAHGSTGAGNDQIRFDLCFNVLVPNVEIITPIRDQKLSRQQEVSYLQNLGYNFSWKKSTYSINQGLWGTSVGGKETLVSNQSLPESAYPSQVEQTTPLEIEIGFNKGEIFSINGEKDAGPALIKTLNKIAAPFGIGRDTHVGDTIIGIKGRVGFEAAAPLIIIKAHELLEKHTLSKWQMYWKNQLSNWYGMSLHEGQFFDPVLRNIESFLEQSQTNVTGKVMIKLHPYRFELIGIESKHDLMNPQFGTYGEMNEAWTGNDAKGFTTILSNPHKIYFQVNKVDSI